MFLSILCGTSQLAQLYHYSYNIITIVSQLHRETSWENKPYLEPSIHLCGALFVCIIPNVLFHLLRGKAEATRLAIGRTFEISVVCVVRAMWKRRQWRLSLALHMPFISTTRLVSDTRPFSGCFVVQPQLKRPKQELLGYARHSLYLQQTQQSTLRALPFGRPTSCGARKKTASCYK